MKGFIFCLSLFSISALVSSNTIIDRTEFCPDIQFIAHPNGEFLYLEARESDRRARLVCDPGYDLVDPSVHTILCIDGQWGDEMPECRESYNVGCFNDNRWSRDLNEASYTSDDMTNEVCRQYCFDREFVYSATQNGDECRCGNSFGSYGAARESECNSPCSGQEEEFCGGKWRNSVYSTQYEPSMETTTSQMESTTTASTSACNSSYTGNPDDEFLVAMRAVRRFQNIECRIREHVEDYYSYNYDNADFINDGGNDMFDGGNQVFINVGDEERQMPYGMSYSSDNFQFASRQGQPFHAVMWVENTNNPEENMDSFYIKVSGNTGADGAGYIEQFNGNMEYEGMIMDWYAFQVFGADDPVIAEVYYRVYSPENWQSENYNSWSQDFSTSTADLQNQVELDTQATRSFLGYMLLSKFPSDSPINQDAIENVMQEVMQAYSGIDISEKDSEMRFNVDEINADQSIAGRALNSMQQIEDEVIMRIDGFHYYKYDGSNVDENNVPLNNSIYDGARDMYDDGNMVYFSRPENQDEAVRYGAQYSYDTHQFATRARHPFQAVMWVDNNEEQNNQEQFFLRVAGNTGADGYGEVETFRGSLEEGNFYMKYAVFQISGASDPVICEVYYVVGNEENWQSTSSFDFEFNDNFKQSTSDTNNEVSIPFDTQRVFMGYTLLSRRQDEPITENAVRDALKVILTSYNYVNVSSPDDEPTTTEQPRSTQSTTEQSTTTTYAEEENWANEVVNSLNEASVEESINNAVWRMHKYQYDGTRGSINDGGQDMFDEGNKVFIPDEDDFVTYNEDYTSDDGSYKFTTSAGMPFHGVMWIDNQQGSDERRQNREDFFIRVEGNAGADGVGEVVSYDGSIEQADYNMKYFVQQIYNSKDPIICEVFYAINNPNRWGSSPSEMDFQSRFASSSIDRLESEVTLSGDTQRALMGYTLLSRSASVSSMKIAQDTVEDVLRIILNNIHNNVDIGRGQVQPSTERTTTDADARDRSTTTESAKVEYNTLLGPSFFERTKNFRVNFQQEYDFIPSVSEFRIEADSQNEDIKFEGQITNVDNNGLDIEVTRTDTDNEYSGWDQSPRFFYTLDASTAVRQSDLQDDSIIGSVFSCFRNNQDDMQSDIRDYNQYQYDTSVPMTSISDGGNDMFDTGNQLFFPNPFGGQVNAEYDQWYSFKKNEFASQSSQPFQAALWIDQWKREDLPEEFSHPFFLQVMGNLGADGNGDNVQYNGTLMSNNYFMKYAVSQTYGAGDPSVCEVFYTISSHNNNYWNSHDQNDNDFMFEFNDNTDETDNTAYMSANSARSFLGYTLLSSKRSEMIEQSEVEQVLARMFSCYSQLNVNNPEEPLEQTESPWDQDATTAAYATNETATNQYGCLFNQEWNECGTACPLKCGEDRAEFCTMNCVIGCQCPDGYWEKEDGSCVEQESQCYEDWGHPQCVFPFMYNGQMYDSCTTADFGDTLWCSFDSMYIGRWAECRTDYSMTTTPEMTTGPQMTTMAEISTMAASTFFEVTTQMATTTQSTTQETTPEPTTTTTEATTTEATTTTPQTTTEDPCQDVERHQRNCPRWTQANFCTSGRYTNFMRLNCQKSCGFCPEVTTTTTTEATTTTTQATTTTTTEATTTTQAPTTVEYTTAQETTQQQFTTNQQTSQEYTTNQQSTQGGYTSNEQSTQGYTTFEYSDMSTQQETTFADMSTDATSSSVFTCITGMTSHVGGRLQTEEATSTICTAGEQACYQLVMGLTSTQVNMEVVTISGGCFSPFMESSINVGPDQASAFLPENMELTTYQFETCQENDCFNLYPSGVSPTEKAENFTCISGSRGYSNGQLTQDETQEEVCMPPLQSCYQIVMSMNSEFMGMSMEVMTVTGGCYHESMEASINAGFEQAVQTLPEGMEISTYEFDTCDEKNCFDLSPGAMNKTGNETDMSDYLTCMQGTVVQNLQTNVTQYDNTKQEACQSHQSHCFIYYYNAATDEGEIQTTMGGCIDQRTMDIFSEEGALESFLPEDLDITFSGYNTCNESNCFYFSRPDSQPTVNCNSGVTLTNGDTGEIIFSYETTEQCRVHNSCETVRYSQIDEESQEVVNYRFSGCGDPDSTQWSWANVVPFQPPTEYGPYYFCQNFGCFEGRQGLCICPRDFDSAEYVETSQRRQEQCYSDMCNKFEVCPMNQEWQSCGTACPLMCGEEEPEICTMNCVIGCQCRPGYWQKADGSCVEVESQCYDGIVCMTGEVVVLQQNGMVAGDFTQEQRCQQDQQSCYKRVAELFSPDMGYLISTTGGCMNEDYIDMYDIGFDIEDYLGDNFTMTSYSFDSCNTSNCFDYRPEDSFETVTCNSGLVIVNEATDQVVYNSMFQQTCREHTTCDTMTLKFVPKNETSSFDFTWYGCGDPYSTQTSGNLAPFVPDEFTMNYETCQNIDEGCIDYFTGACLCKQDFDLSDYGDVYNSNKISCEGDLCNTGYSNMTCIKGTVTVDLNTDEVLVDETKEVTCSVWETQCYQQEVEMIHNDWEVVTSTGGCFSESYRDMIDVGADTVQQYLAEGVTVRDYFFDTCNGSNCFDYQIDSNSTLNCNNGVTVTDEETGETLFSYHYPEQCKVHDFCETVTVSRTDNFSGQKLQFMYAGCGDPYNTRYEDVNVLPFVPTSVNEASRVQKCAQWGCTESFMGLCLCPRDFDYSQWTMADASKERCYEDMCNTGSKQSDFTCITGTVTMDMNTNEVIFDESQETVCNYGESACYVQNIELVHEDWQVYTMTGGCFDESYRDIADPGAENIESFMQEGATVQSYMFRTCNDSTNCFDYGPFESQETIMCNSGVTITDVMSGDVEYSYHKSEQCKVHSSCETVTVTQYEFADMKTRKYQYSGCGDPYNTRYENLNVLPYVPPSADEAERMDKCMQWGCTESFMGLCLCPRNLNTSSYVSLFDINKDMCNEEMCNLGEPNLMDENGQ